MIEIVNGDLFNSTEDFLCHQVNCVTKRAAHLSKAVFTRFPYADIYTNRASPDIPGTILVRGDGRNTRKIVNMLGQYYPGRPRYPSSNIDGFKARQKYFLSCLRVMSVQLSGDFAFPYGIGCGAAGGDWNEYLAMLTRFSHAISGRVRIYKL